MWWNISWATVTDALFLALNGNCCFTGRMPSVYSHHIFHNNNISAGDVERQIISHNPTTDPPTHTLCQPYQCSMRNYIPQENWGETDTRLSLSYCWNLNTYQTAICCSPLCKGLKWFLYFSFNYHIKGLTGSASWLHSQAAISLFQ